MKKGKYKPPETKDPKAKLGLTPKQALFVQSFIVTDNAAEAARSAGYGSTSKSSKSIGHQLLLKAEIREAITALRSAVMKKAEYTLETAMEEQGRVFDAAFAAKQYMSAQRASETRAKLSGLLREKLDISVEHIDLAGAMIEARKRLATVLPLSTLPALSAPVQDAEYRVLSVERLPDQAEPANADRLPAEQAELAAMLE